MLALKKRKQGIFSCISILILYIANEFAFKKIDVPIVTPFMNWYFNDLMAIPLYLEFLNCVIGIRIINGKIIAILVFVACIWWELLAPLYVVGSVFDWVDILMYLLGATIYWKYSNKNIAKSQKRLMT